jgi:hypothetical protein
MKMLARVYLYVDGCESALFHAFEDDVDAEGTMYAKYIQPIVDRALDDMTPVPLEFGRYTIVKPWRIVAFEYTVSSLEDA